VYSVSAIGTSLLCIF